MKCQSYLVRVYDLRKLLSLNCDQSDQNNIKVYDFLDTIPYGSNYSDTGILPYLKNTTKTLNHYIQLKNIDYTCMCALTGVQNDTMKHILTNFLEVKITTRMIEYDSHDNYVKSYSISLVDVAKIPANHELNQIVPIGVNFSLDYNIYYKIGFVYFQEYIPTRCTIEDYIKFKNKMTQSTIDVYRHCRFLLSVQQYNIYMKVIKENKIIGTEFVKIMYRNPIEEKYNEEKYWRNCSCSIL